MGQNITDNAIDELFKSGDILDSDKDTLLTILSRNCSVTIGSSGHKQIIRGITVNNILMQRHIDSLNKSNRTIQCWVILLACIATLAAITQIIVTILE